MTVISTIRFRDPNEPGAVEEFHLHGKWIGSPPEDPFYDWGPLWVENLVLADGVYTYSYNDTMKQTFNIYMTAHAADGTVSVPSNVKVIPEPGFILLIVAGLVGLWVLSRMR